MADIISDDDLDALSITKYDTLRPDLRSGDLFFASGNYWVSRAIRFGTDSVWSHVGILFVLPNIDRLLLLESVEDAGVRFAPLSKYLVDYEKGKPYDGRIAVARSKWVTKAKTDDLARFGTDELARPYDNDEIGRIIARIALGEGKPKKDRAYICSELVYACFAAAGYEFAYSKKGFISPADVWSDEKVRLMARIQ
jgi:uncharacterized protein YycO